MSYSAWLQYAIGLLQQSESPKRDAEILLTSVTGKNRAFILAFGETLLDELQLNDLQQRLQRRIQGEPIAYIVGEREFWSLPLSVSSATLIPRPDTEKLVELALEHLPTQPCRILDLGTGTGAIALALATERPDCQLIAIDISPAAVELARANAQQLAVNNVQFLTGDWFAPVQQQRFTMIVSNPPYIADSDLHLQQGDVRFEPDSALVAAEEGMADLRQIVTAAPHYLLDGGWLLLEHGWQQGAAVRELLLQAGFHQIITKRDYGGNDRVTLGCLVG